MLNKKENNFINNMSYYYIAHFSKFIKTGAKRIAFSKYTNDLEVTSFYNADKTIAIVILNRSNFSKNFTLCINNKIHNDNISGHSIITFVISDL